MKTLRHSIVEEDLNRIVAADLPWSDLDGATILVTGASGFIPAYMVETLLYLNERKIMAKPIRVLALVRNRQEAGKRFAAYEGRTDLQFVVQDVSEPLQIKEPAHYLIHAASQASPKHYAPDPAGTFKPNVIGMYHLLEHARTLGTRGFLFLSSGEVYGKFESTPAEPISEAQYGSSDPLELRSCYAEGKRAGETMCKAWAHQYGIPTRVARLGHTYGPGMRLDDGRVYADLVANIVRNQDIVLKSDGTALRLFCYLADAVVGLFTVLLKGENATAYNVMNDEGEIRIGDLADLLCRLFPEKGLKVVRPGAETTSKHAVWNSGFPVSMQKVRALGWSPSTSVESGFQRTILFYEAQKAFPAQASSVVKRSKRSRDFSAGTSLGKVQIDGSSSSVLQEDLARILAQTEGLWEDLRGQSIFVTGGTGFFGRWLLESFARANNALQLGAHMVVLSRNPEKLEAAAPDFYADPAIRFVRGDVRTFTTEKVRSQLGSAAPAKFRFVIHAATEASAKLNAENPLLMVDTIVAGTRSALDFAVASGARRFLLTSSGAIYGAQPSEMTHVAEDYVGGPDSTNANSAYAEGKRLAELLCACYQKQHGLASVITRCFAFVGPFLPLDTHFAIGNFIRDTRAGGPVRIGGDGTPYRSYLYAADLVVWLWTILLKGRPARAYNVGSAQDLTIAELAHAVRAALDPAVEVMIAKKAEPAAVPSRYVPDVTRAASELGLRETVGLTEAIQRTARHQS